MRAYYVRFQRGKTVEMAAISTIYNNKNVLYTLHGNLQEVRFVKRNQQIRFVLFGVLMVAMLMRLAQNGLFSQPAGYVLLLAAAVAGAAWFSRRQAQHAVADGFCHLSKGETPSVRFKDVAANEEALEAMQDLVSFIRQPEQYARLGARIPRGVLLYGLPGTGKTLMARALAGEAGVPFFAVNGADFVEMYVGVGASRIRALFQKARQAGRAVIFFDEIDAIGKKRDNRSDEREQTLNALLSEMSGFGQSDGVIVVAATNRVDTLDEALLRAGRFDRQIEVPLPSVEERRRILEVHAQRMPVAAEVSFGELARQTALFSGAKLECLLNEAAILAAKRGAEEIAQTDVQTAMDRSLFGMERRGGKRLEHERRVTAAHEAGHAVATAVLLQENELTKVSIIPTSRGAAGYSLSLPQEKMFHEKTELLSHIAVALAGREAERLLVGSERVSTGASNDIEKAALIARRMVQEWGMLPGSEEVCLFSQQQRDQACQQWMQQGQQMAAGVLMRHQAAWERLTELLLERETVTGAEALRCMEAG